MKRILITLSICALLGAVVFWLLTTPAILPADYADGLAGNAEEGAVIFAAGGCQSCHATPEAKGDDRLLLSGGLPFPSDFGTFYAPNISPDKTHGIGGWTQVQFARAVTKGVSPNGAHYYPAFPYTAYAHMTAQDVVNLFAYLQSLPAADTHSKAHDVGFPFNIRRGLGLWKLLFASDDYVLAGELSDEVQRGRYLAEGLAHCGECHTPRNAVGGLKRDQWLGGAPNPSGKGTIPNITPGKLEWSNDELLEYFTTGFTPEYDNAGGEMAEVVSNLAQLPEGDRAAIAAYLKAIPAVK